MNGPERKNMKLSNFMTAYTKSELEKALKQAKTDLSKAQLAIGEAAGRESDWHDNAAFDFANMNFDLQSAKVANLAGKLRSVEIISPRKQTETIEVGNTVIVKFEGETENEKFTILGADDSGRKPGWLSCYSPLGKNLLGKKEQDLAEYSLEADKKQKVKIIKVLPGDF
jgi:transcription elongation GreA/GreB family factor